MLSQKTGSPWRCLLGKLEMFVHSRERRNCSFYLQTRQTVTKFVRGVFAGDQMPLNHQTDHFISFRFNEMHEVLK